MTRYSHAVPVNRRLTALLVNFICDSCTEGSGPGQHIVLELLMNRCHQMAAWMGVLLCLISSINSRANAQSAPGECLEAVRCNLRSKIRSSADDGGLCTGAPQWIRHCLGGE